ncbi:Fc.00g042570.m01.CDS01 [Cosmosporella sp. VM-42]
MQSSLHSVGLVDLLHSDPRPTFVVAVPSPQSQSTSKIVYQNPALTANATLCRSILAIPQDTSHAPFWDWVTKLPPTRQSHADIQHSLSYLNVFWTRNVIQNSWVVMSGNETPPSSEPPRKIRLENKDGGVGRKYPQNPTLDSPSLVSRSKSESKAPILYRADTDPSLMIPTFESETESFLHVVQSSDWESTSLGPMENWPSQLQSIFNQVISDSRAIAIFWGHDFITIYNEAFSKYCGTKHPRLLGQTAAESWPYLQERLSEIMASPLKKYSKTEDESRFFVEQADGSSEETYAKWSMTPIIENKKCSGVQYSLLETTSMRLWERRMKMLIDLGEALVTARDVKSYWAKTIEELERWSPTYDVPLAFIYAVEDDDENDSSKSRYDCPKLCHLEGSLGVPENHVIAPPLLNLRDTDDGLAPMLREALRSPLPLLLQTKEETLPRRLLQGLQWRGFGDPCQAAIICPIRPTKEENVMGILFLGLNPRRPYDNDYRQFVSLLNQKLTSSLASTVLLEEEARRGRNAAEQAAYDTAMLKKRLEYQTEQANRSIQTFKAVAEFIPVGMCFVDTDGNVTYANDAWHRITGYPKGPIAPGALLENVMEADKAKVIQAYEDVKKMDVVTFEYRVPRSNKQPDGLKSPTGALSGMDGRVARHILASTKAERADDGSVVRMLTCLTDVTVQKDTAGEAIRRAQEAENLKRLAEFATVGMYDMSMDGRLLSANNLFWELSGLAKVDLTKHVVKPWPTTVVEEDLSVLEDSLKKLEESGKPQTAEIRLKTSWITEDSSGNTAVASRWVLATFMPVKSPDGIIQSFTGCLSDVSVQKWQLEQEKLRKEEAIESKRQQENFIDMTSHEMRNPLSAILHCTDAIIASLTRVQDITENQTPLTPTRTDVNMSDRTPSIERSDEEKKLLEDSIENAETIVTCAQHQKRIVDDILTMSKLDSKLLAVTPCTVNPVQMVNDALKMFEVEARRVDIELTSLVDKSYTNLGYDYLDLDPSRVKQVLINLLTNALKFTKSGETRMVTLCVKGSLSRPGPDMTTVEFIPRFCDVSEEYDQPALKGRSDPVYLMFEVKDTGQGLTAMEMGNLFNKFVQASAKTHIKYGGSGLGLFISRRLTELQNGAIGVSSQPGVGSTFAFYIEAYLPSEASRNEALAAAAAARMVANADASDGDLKRSGSSRGSRRQNHQNPGHNIRLDGILIVEDNLINQQITRRGLSDRGYTLDVANHGIEALEKLRRSQGNFVNPSRQGSLGVGNSSRDSPTPQPMAINLVLMDIEMPIQDGLTCTRHIRELEQNGDIFCASGGRIPIIAVTANARPEQVQEAKQAGCDDVLVKPYRIPELIEKMQVVVRRMGGLSPDSPAR